MEDPDTPIVIVVPTGPEEGELPPSRPRIPDLLERILAITCGGVAATGLVCFGITFALTLKGGVLSAYYPKPGAMTGAHQRILGSDGAGCASCHEHETLAKGCLGCHEEIANQLSVGAGFHAYMLDGEPPRCTPCHSEHQGDGFELISERSWQDRGPEGFEHPHVDFRLTHRHRELECRACHVERRRGGVTVRGPDGVPDDSTYRELSFIGLQQECVFCHDDPHTGGRLDDCTECHEQSGFRPAMRFDHSRFLVLDGGHAGVECRECHQFDEREVARATTQGEMFAVARGEACGDCHEPPHRADFPATCETCHRRVAERWLADPRAMTPALHARGGFPLDGPHREVSCEECHPPALEYAARFPDPAAPGYVRTRETCWGCHGEAHDGQFVWGERNCLDCHEETRFQPARFGEEEHRAVFALEGAHQAVACRRCHPASERSGSPRFVGTPHQCAECHESPHGDQFGQEMVGEGCVSCHRRGSESFSMAEFDHEERTGFALVRNHAEAACGDCHVEDLLASTTGVARRIYRGTSTACASCHLDRHQGQFREGAEGEVDCSRCHVEGGEWRPELFDHETMSRFPLEEAHADVECSACHLPVRLPNGTEFTQFKPVGAECNDCHEVVPEGKSAR